MSLIRSIKASVLRNHIQKLAPGSHRERAGIKFSDIRKIGMVIDGTTEESIKFAMKYRDEQQLSGKVVELMAYVPRMAKDKSYLLPFFTNKESNWYLKPIGGEVRNFITQAFDLLVNTSPDKIMPIEYICALSHAHYIIGNGTDHLNGYYDCLIKVNDSYSYASFMENVHHYLNLQA